MVPEGPLPVSAFPCQTVTARASNTQTSRAEKPTESAATFRPSLMQPTVPGHLLCIEPRASTLTGCRKGGGSVRAACSSGPGAPTPCRGSDQHLPSSCRAEHGVNETRSALRSTLGGSASRQEAIKHIGPGNEGTHAPCGHQRAAQGL